MKLLKKPGPKRSEINIFNLRVSCKTIYISLLSTTTCKLKAKEILLSLLPQLYQSAALWPGPWARLLEIQFGWLLLLDKWRWAAGQLHWNLGGNWFWLAVGQETTCSQFHFEILNCIKSNQFDLLSFTNQWMDERKIQFFVQPCTEFKRPHPILYNIFISVWCRLQLAGMRQGAGLLLLVMDCIGYSAAKASLY